MQKAQLGGIIDFFPGFRYDFFDFLSGKDDIPLCPLLQSFHLLVEAVVASLSVCPQLAYGFPYSPKLRIVRMTLKASFVGKGKHFVGILSKVCDFTFIVKPDSCQDI